MSIDTDPCCMAMNPDMALSDGMGRGFTHGFKGYSQQTVPLDPRVSKSASLHSVQSVLLLFLPRLSYIIMTHAGG